ncbi:hypothetical protein DC365_19645 [Vibrio vulnificus]|nr:hypothetical protein DC365_19645 [Vibrio vulnificus]
MQAHGLNLSFPLFKPDCKHIGETQNKAMRIKPMALTLTTHIHSLLRKLNGHTKRGTYIADK